MNRRVFLTALGAVATHQRLRQGVNQIALESLGVDTSAATTLTTTRYPYVQNVRHNRASILWATQELGTGSVIYSADGVNFTRVPAGRRTFTAAETGAPRDVGQDQANIGGLQPGTNYVYRVAVDGIEVTPGGDTRFRTAGPGDFRFAVIGDSGYDPSGGGNTAQFAIAQRLLAEKPALVIHTGDVVYLGTGQVGTSVDLYQRNYFNYYYGAMSSIPFFPSPGNHDFGPTLTPYIQVHAVPNENVPTPDRGHYYSFDWGNVHFVSVDAHAALERAINLGGPLLKWLESDLRSTRQFFRIIYFHYPPFAAGPNMNDVHSAWVRQYIVPLAEMYGVQVVLTGHEHSYQRSQPMRKSAFVTPDVGTNYLSSGGGGAFLYDVYNVPVVAFGKSAYHYLRADVQGTQITFRAIRNDGVELDRYTVAPRPMFSDDPAVVPVVMTPGPTTGATIRILGRNLASDESYACTPVPPTDLSGTTVTVNGTPVQLLYVSPTQIYAQLPFDVSGNITIRVTSANGFSEISL